MNTSPQHSKFPEDSTDREYDIFEVLPDGSPIWRTSAFGMESAEQKLLELSRRTGNRFFAANLADLSEVVTFSPESSRRVN
jgi:hypothetical protein